VNDLDLKAIVRDGLAAVRLEVPAEAVLARGQAIKTRRRSVLAGAAAVVAAAVAAGGLAVAGPGRPAAEASGQTGARSAVSRAASTQPQPRTQPQPSRPATVTAWTVTHSGRWLRVTIRQLADLPGLQATLRADGARVVVTGSLAWPSACSPWRSANYQMGDVIRMQNVTGLPSRDGSEFYIDPAQIPAGALLFIGQSPVGKPPGVIGPPGPMASGYLTDTPACFGS
jgi:hypothetical protein